MDKKEVIAASVMLRLISFAPSPGWKSHLKRRATATTDSLQPTRNLSKKMGGREPRPHRNAGGSCHEAGGRCGGKRIIELRSETIMECPLR
jgi:hypothetical protein